MRHLFITTEMLRRAGITTMYRASIALAISTKPGITTAQLSKLMETSAEAIRVVLEFLERKNLVRLEKLTHRNGTSKATKVYPAPYLKDVIADIDGQHHLAHTTTTDDH